MAKATVRVGERVLVFDNEQFENVELMDVERETGMTTLEWQLKLQHGSVTASTALVWMLRRRNGEPQLRFDEVKFDMRDLFIDLNLDGEEEAEGKDDALAPPAPAPAPPPVPPAMAMAIDPALASRLAEVTREYNAARPQPAPWPNGTETSSSPTPSTTTGSPS
jgi:hypothetical protein